MADTLTDSPPMIATRAHDRIEPRRIPVPEPEPEPVPALDPALFPPGLTSPRPEP
jgi:hypothetical protein